MTKETAKTFVSQNLISAYKNFVISGIETEREFIKDCFWSGDPINSESEYNTIVKAIHTLL